MNNQVEYVESEKRKRKVIYEGYLYEKQKSDATKSEWQRGKRGICKARMHGSPTGTVCYSPFWCPYSCTEQTASGKFETFGSCQNGSFNQSTSHCPSSCKQLLKNVPGPVAAHLPSKSSAKRTVQRLWERAQAAPANPLDRNFPIPAPFFFI